MSDPDPFMPCEFTWVSLTMPRSISAPIWAALPRTTRNQQSQKVSLLLLKIPTTQSRHHHTTYCSPPFLIGVNVPRIHYLQILSTLWSLHHNHSPPLSCRLLALRGRHYHLPHSVFPPTIVQANLATCSSLQSWLCSSAASLRLRLPEELLPLEHLTALEIDQPHGGNPPCCPEFPFARKLPVANPLVETWNRTQTHGPNTWLGQVLPNGPWA